MFIDISPVTSMPSTSNTSTTIAANKHERAVILLPVPQESIAIAYNLEVRDMELLFNQFNRYFY